MTVFIPPAHILGVLRRLTENGHAAYLVGGGVRDCILGRTVHDWDVATSARTDEITKLFKKTVLTGVKFGTVTIVLPECKVEVTTFRTDGEYRDGRRPENVSFVAELGDDLKRRDFTINAIAMSENGEIIDPLGGCGDLKNEIIRCVGDPLTRFREDGLRMLRALRFKAQLGFTVERGTMAAIRELAAESARLSAERIRDEILKTLMSDSPETAGDMVRLGLLTGTIPATDLPRGTLVRVRHLPRDITLRWCAFCAVLRGAGLIDSAGDFTREMKLDGKTVKICADASEITCLSDSVTGIKRLLARYGIMAVRAAAAADYVLHDVNTLALTDKVLESGECFSLSKLAVSGCDLIDAGFLPGAELGKTLNVLLMHVIEHPQDNSYDILIKLAGSSGILK